MKNENIKERSLTKLDEYAVLISKHWKGSKTSADGCDPTSILVNFKEDIEKAIKNELISDGWIKPLWHKVADGDLPTKTGKYLTRYDTGYNRVLLYCVEDNLGPYDEGYDFDKDDNMINIKKGFNDFDGESCEYFTTNSVIAWMEIPGYKE